MPSRRAVLAGGVTLGGSFAGCVSFTGSDSPSEAGLELRDVSDRELAESVYDPYDVPGEILDDALAADRAITTAPAVYPEGSVERHDDGSYYVLDVQLSGPTWTEYAIEFDPSSGDGDEDADPIPVGELPAIDRAVVTDAFGGDSEPESGQSSGGETSLDDATRRIYDEADRKRSTFVGEDPLTISRQGSIYQVEIERGHVVPGIATISAEQVAADAENFGAYLRSERAVSLTDLSTAERNVVEKAIAGGYETGTDDGAFASILRRLEAEWQVDDRTDTLVVRFDGETYLAELRGLEHYRGDQG